MVKKQFVENQWNRKFGPYPNSSDEKPVVYFVFPFREEDKKLRYKYSLNPIKETIEIPYVPSAEARGNNPVFVGYGNPDPFLAVVNCKYSTHYQK